MTQRHTPGPWRFREYALSDEMIAEAKEMGMKLVRFVNNDGSVPVSAGDTRICVVDPQAKFKRGAGHVAECQERDANARLIAAAPELLEACRRLLFNARHGNGLEALYEAKDFAEAAIAKAEARS